MVSYGRAWANVSNTPFKLYKHWVNEGGISTPMIAHWPGGIKARGQIRQQPAHLIDVMATCVDLAGATYPSEFEGHKIPPMEGVSLAPAFDPNKPLERTLYFEHEGNRAVRDGKWKLVAEYGKPWTLHNTDTDRSEMHDLSAEEPEVVKDLLAKYETWALRVGVRPWVSWEEARTPKPGYVPPKRDYPKTSDDLDREGVGVKVIEGRGETWKKKEDQ
jgi:arylsulfatase A-like enzyme